MEKIDDEKLILEIKKYKNLYEKGSPGYRNKFKRAKAWAEISAAIGANETFCQSRWKNIRYRYVKLNQKKLSSGSESIIPESSWSLIRHLEFLSDHIQPRKTISSVPVADLLSEESSLFPLTEENSQSVDVSFNFEPLEELSSTPSTSNKRKSVRQCDDPVANKMCELITQFTKFTESRQTQGDQHNPFFKMIDQKFHVIPDEQIDQIKLNILNSVFDCATKVENQESIEDVVLM